MQLAFSTNAYLNHSFADTCARLAGIGYRGVEIMADVPHAWPAYLLPEHKRGLRDALTNNGLSIANVNAFMMHAVNDHRQKYWHPSWIEPDANYRRVRIDHTKRALTLAKELGAPCITTMSAPASISACAQDRRFPAAKLPPSRACNGGGR